MKFLLLPVTLLLWLILTYLLLWVGFSASLIIVNFSWITLLFSSAILFTIGILIAVIVPTTISVLIEAFYKNRFINRLHAIFGIIGVLLFLNLLTADHVKNLITINWINHRAKIIVLSIPMIGFFISMVYSSISMILIKNKNNDKSNNDDDDSIVFTKVDGSGKSNIDTPTIEEMKEFNLKARAYRSAKQKVQAERAARNINNSLNSEKEN